MKMVINFLYKVQVSAGQAIRKVPFFTASGGLSTPNKRFEFNATIENRTAFGDANHTFTKSNVVD